MVRDLLAAVVRVMRYWREAADRKMPPDDLGYLSHDSFTFWMDRVSRAERNGTMRRD
jgi:hypothetical protein